MNLRPNILISLTVSTDWDPYNVNDVANKYLSPSSSPSGSSFDVLDIDTILLGEVADHGTLQHLNLRRVNFLVWDWMQ